MFPRAASPDIRPDADHVIPEKKEHEVNHDHEEKDHHEQHPSPSSPAPEPGTINPVPAAVTRDEQHSHIDIDSTVEPAVREGSAPISATAPKQSASVLPTAREGSVHVAPTIHEGSAHVTLTALEGSAQVAPTGNEGSELIAPTSRERPAHNTPTSLNHVPMVMSSTSPRLAVHSKITDVDAAAAATVVSEGPAQQNHAELPHESIGPSMESAASLPALVNGSMTAPSASGLDQPGTLASAARELTSPHSAAEATPGARTEPEESHPAASDMMPVSPPGNVPDVQHSRVAGPFGSAASITVNDVQDGNVNGPSRLPNYPASVSANELPVASREQQDAVRSNRKRLRDDSVSAAAPSSSHRPPQYGRMHVGGGAASSAMEGDIEIVEVVNPIDAQQTAQKAKKRERGPSSPETLCKPSELSTQPVSKPPSAAEETAPAKTTRDFINTTCRGRVDVAAYGGHRIVAVIDGTEYTGWVRAVHIPEDEKQPFTDPVNPENGVPEEVGQSEIAIPSIPKVDPRDGTLRSNLRKSSVHSQSVIVVGAGIAGIAAARVLTDRGYRVTILEARGRIGGRIATDWSFGCPVELGACFIHGSYGNPLSEIAREAELRTYSPTDVGKLIFENGKPVDDVTDRHANELWNALIRRARRVAENKGLVVNRQDMSLGTLLSHLKKKAVDKVTKEVDQLLAWHAANLEAACAADLPELSARHYDMDDKCGFAGPHEIVRDGYSSIVHALAKNLDIVTSSEVVSVEGSVLFHDDEQSKARRRKSAARRRLSLKKDVTLDPMAKVRYLDGTRKNGMAVEGNDFEATSNSSGVRVTTANGVQHVAEWCVVTVPLGVLQAKAVQFDPPLPDWKQNAIDNIGFGLVNKVVMRFDSAFWVDNESEEQRDPRVADGPDQIGRVSCEHGVFFMFLSLLRCVGAPVLVATTAGAFAEHIEDMSDGAVADMALTALTKMFKPNTVSTLLGYTVTRWKADEFSRGSYSYAKVGTTPRHYMEMSEPCGKVFFAGEATHSNHPATAHGAFMSGIREAGRIIGKCETVTSLKRRYARELFLLQEPHASFCGFGKDGVPAKNRVNGKVKKEEKEKGGSSRKRARNK